MIHYNKMKEQVLLLVLSVLHTCLSTEKPIIQLPNGQILGQVAITSTDNEYYLFEGIPYGAPPVGALRFKAPEPPENWEGILNATNLEKTCYQLPIGRMLRSSQSYVESEDCLYLNVYTPISSEEDTEPLAVMVYIFSGAFQIGWSKDYAPDMFINNGVILVTINYRLGPLGFLSTQDEVIPGNAGLKDQALALQWVHDNINLFGGDPEKVTIFGQSAGGGSCAYHLLNQNSEGLFSRAILESGTFLSPGMFQRNSRQIAFGVGAALDPSFEDSEDSQALYELLMSVEPEDLIFAGSQYASSIANIWDDLVDQGSLWAPTIEVKNTDAYVTKKMYGLLKAGNILPITTMMGFTSEESVLGKNDPEQIKSVLEVLDENLQHLVPNDMQITDLDAQKEMGEKIRDIYTNGEPLADHVGAGIRFSSDNTLTRAVHKHAELFSQVGKVYFYQFSYDGQIGGIDAVNFGDGAGTVGHTEELKYLFCSGETCTSDTWPEGDLLTRQRLLKLWTNFAKFENPTPESDELLQNVTWPQLSLEGGDFFYLDIGENLEVKNHPKQESYEGWTALYDSLGYDDFDSY